MTRKFFFLSFLVILVIETIDSLKALQNRRCKYDDIKTLKLFVFMGLLRFVSFSLISQILFLTKKKRSLAKTN
jgi:hypothetical protein